MKFEPDNSNPNEILSENAISIIRVIIIALLIAFILINTNELGNELQ